VEIVESNAVPVQMKNKDIHPPRLAEKILNWYCGHAVIEDLLGDSQELFYRDLNHMPAWRARLNYWKHILSLLISYSVEKRKKKAAFHYLSSATFSPAMFKNYLTIGGRNLIKHKFFTILNVLGLAIGMSISLLLIAMLSFLWTYDAFHENKDRIYRVITKVNDQRKLREFATAPTILADKMSNEITGVDAVVRINTLSANVIKGESEIPVHGYFVDDNFTTVFTFPLLKGNAKSPFNNQNSALITPKAAMKLFGDVDPVGKVVELSGIGPLEISGLLQEIPKNSHMQFEILVPYQKWLTLERNDATVLEGDLWPYRNSYVYLLLAESSVIDKVEQFLNHIPKSFYTTKENYSVLFELQTLMDIAPGPELNNQIGPDWGYASLSIFMVLTLLILLPACFNYANISISRALKRMKEIGLRKTMGGQRSQIFTQFITETVIITLIALLFSYYIFVMVREEFLSMIVGAESLDLSPTLVTILCFVLFAILVGFVAGVIPAVYFSKLNPIEALKSKPIGKGFAKLNFRKVLVVFQFALSLGFIMGVVVMLNQYRHSLNYDFGFDQENILDVELQGVDPQLLKNEFAKLSAVQSLSMSSGVVGTSSSGNTWLKKDAADSIEVAQLFVDHNFISNMKLELLAGKNFTDDPVSKNGVIVNETFLKTLQLPEPAAAIDKTYTVDGTKEITVVGVVKDFHYADLQTPIQSFFFRYDPVQFNFANVKIVSTDMASTLAEMESSWKKIAGEKKFMARFFDDEIKEAYVVYFSMIKICGFLGFLAISISCLGLLGMVVFTVENRMKEVGVRKVLGATAWSITVVLSRDFVRLMGIAAFIAIPIAYVFYEKLYLETQRYYHINIGILEITISLLITVFLGLATILSQTVRAARVNPVETLRYE
jgi:putative ABC transport system permease protein